MPYVRIDLIEGRTVEQKRALVKAITASIVDIANVAPENVHIIFNDIKKHDLGQKGELKSDQ